MYGKSISCVFPVINDNNFVANSLQKGQTFKFIVCQILVKFFSVFWENAKQYQTFEVGVKIIVRLTW